MRQVLVGGPHTFTNRFRRLALSLSCSSRPARKFCHTTRTPVTVAPASCLVVDLILSLLPTFAQACGCVWCSACSVLHCKSYIGHVKALNRTVTSPFRSKVSWAIRNEALERGPPSGSVWFPAKTTPPSRKTVFVCDDFFVGEARNGSSAVVLQWVLDGISRVHPTV